jgi:tripartite-type tricarboxylate transporter receptor subunit TctC
MQRRTLLQASLASCFAQFAGWAQAQDKYPSKPITWYCPYAAGGNGDTRSRQIAKVMSTLLGQAIIVENKAGAGGNIGTEAIARAKPDGYTLGLGNFAPMAVNQTLFKKLNFDPQNDIVPIMLIEKGPLILMVRNDSPYKNVQDIVNAAKVAPGKLAYASGGIGGTHHVSAALFEAEAGIKMIHAPYKSGAAGATDLMGGQVDLMFEQMYAAMPSLQGGKMRAIAITSKARSPLLPNLPTMGESGYPKVEVLNWQGIVGPKGMPAELVQLINKVGNQALQDADVKQKILSQGNELGGGTPDVFAALIKAESVRWGKVVREAKIEVL